MDRFDPDIPEAIIFPGWGVPGELYWSSLEQSTFASAEIFDYGFFEANTTYGKIGVKVWIYKGEVLAESADAGRRSDRPERRQRRNDNGNRRPQNRDGRRDGSRSFQKNREEGRK